MALPVWPTSLPQTFLRDAYSESAPNNLLRTQFDAGVAKVRPKGAPAAVVLTLSTPLTDSQRTTFKSFVDGTLSGGAIRFEFVHPVDEIDVEMRILPISSTELYRLQPHGHGWIVSFSVEVMP